MQARFVRLQSRPAALRPLGDDGQGARRAGQGQALLPEFPGRMEAIQDMRTMAGSPDADIAMRSASRNLAHGFCVLGFHAFREP